MKLKIWLILRRLLIADCVLFLLVSCNPTPILTSEVLPTSTPMTPPDFVAEVWPAPNAVISKSAYMDSLKVSTPLGMSKGVSVAILINEVNDYRKPAAQSIASRASLDVDGTPAAMDKYQYNGLLQATFRDENGVQHTVERGPLYISWSPILGTGRHQVRLQMMNNIGEMLEYRWEFTITP
jgi:hypothetical protein